MINQSLTKEEYNRLMEGRSRPLTQDPISKRHGGNGTAHAEKSPKKGR